MESRKTALITGASSGLGMEYAKLLAADQSDVILVARRQGRLEELAQKLQTSHPIRAHVVRADLGTSEGPSRVIDAVKARGVEVDFLINNAGFGATGNFSEMPLERALEMIQLNISTLVTLTRAFLPGMISRRSGRILNIGSTAGFQPGPFMAMYYASKAFVNSFTEALSYELRGSGVTATVSCPGATATEFSQVAGNDRSRLFRIGAASSEEVARQGYRAMMAGKPMVIHGFKNKLSAELVRVSPRAAVRAVAASLNRT
jgi:short-subunit dehydrogenase